MIRIMNYFIAAFIVLTCMAVAQVPSLVSYQGRLDDSAGDPVADGSYSVVFTVYDAGSGGNVLWSETQSVTTVNGLFSVLLGSVNPVVDSAFAGATTYLGIQVGVDPEMTPRTQISSAPYAIHAGTADVATSVASAGSDWFVGGDLGDLLTGNGQLVSFPPEEYEYGMKVLNNTIHRAVCTKWNIGLRFYNVEPFFVNADDPSAGISWGGQMFYINTADTDDDAASGATWRQAWWRLDMTQATSPVVKFASTGLQTADVYVRLR